MCGCIGVDEFFFVFLLINVLYYFLWVFEEDREVIEVVFVEDVVLVVEFDNVV